MIFAEPMCCLAVPTEVPRHTPMASGWLSPVSREQRIEGFVCGAASLSERSFRAVLPAVRRRDRQRRGNIRRNRGSPRSTPRCRVLRVRSARYRSAGAVGTRSESLSCAGHCCQHDAAVRRDSSPRCESHRRVLLSASPHGRGCAATASRGQAIGRIQVAFDARSNAQARSVFRLTSDCASSVFVSDASLAVACHPRCVIIRPLRCEPRQRCRRTEH